MPVLKLQPAPTFRAKVPIPIPGGGAADVEFEFKHRTRTDMEAFVESTKSQLDIEAVMDTVIGWDLTDEFNRENVVRLMENYQGAARAIALKYLQELMDLRLGN